VAWLAVGACIGIILLFAGDDFSAGRTSRILLPLLRHFFPDVDVATLRELHGVVRKAAHVIEYALLAFLAYRALRLTIDVSVLATAAWTLGIVLLVASTDELRQSLIEARTGSIVDVGLDLAGGALGVALVVALHRALGIGRPTRPDGATNR
jgi:VanZ family protein